MMNQEEPNVIKELLGQAIGLANSFFNHLGTREKEKTKREEINAKKEAFIVKIKAFVNLMEHGLDKAFDERKILFKELLSLLKELLNEANKREDEKGITLAKNLMELIATLATDSPLKQLGSSLKQLGGGDDEI